MLSNSAYAAFSASISRSGGTISLAEAGQNSIRPTSTGTLGTGSDTVNVTTNCTYGGYKLYVSATNTGGTNLNRSGATTSELADASNYITTSTTATGSETALSKDTWGVGKTASAFSGLQAYNADAGTLKAFYTGTSTSDYTFYYGVNVSTAKTPGTYTGEVLYTVLMDEACTKYTLNFDGNSATTNKLTSQDLDFDATINLADISSTSKIARTGYTLTGWKDQNNNSYGITGTADINPNDLASVTLTAQWQINSYAVTVNKGSNVTAVSGANTYKYGDKVTITATVAAGYHFNGWTVNSGGVTLYSNEAMTTASTTVTPAYFTMPDNAVTVTANAAANTYTIAYNANGGSGSTASQSITYDGGNVTLRANGFSRTGYTFQGWSRGSGASNTVHYNANTAYAINTIVSNAGVAGTNGATINLYAVWKSSTTYMQDFTCSGSGLATNGTTTLTDKRDNNTYVVKKLADGKCWMVQNLKLVGSRTLTSSDSNVTSNFTLTASTGTPSSSTWCTTDSSACDDKSLVYYNSSEASSSSNSSYYGALYNWYAATAGTGKYATSSGNATSSICPKGWHLPTGGASGEFVALDKAWGGDGTNRTGANTYSTFTGAYTSGNNGGFGLAGYICGSVYDVGSYGRYWSSTALSSFYAYRLYLDSGSTYVNPQDGSNKYYGFSVRCVASS